MNTARIKVSFRKDDPTPPNIFPDFDWIRENEERLLEQYGEGFVVVFNKQVLGFGTTYQSAIDNAERNLPPEFGEVTPVIDTIYHRLLFTRLLLHTARPSDPDAADS